MNHHGMRIVFAFLITLSLAVAGCGNNPPVGKVRGLVTIDGEPLNDALLTFVPIAGGKAAVGKTNKSGEYQMHLRGITGVRVGEYKVVIHSIRPPAETKLIHVRAGSKEYEQQIKDQAMGVNQTKAPPESVSKRSIPDRYNTKTELRIEITEGENKIDLELSSSAK